MTCFVFVIVAVARHWPTDTSYLCILKKCNNISFTHQIEWVVIKDKNAIALVIPFCYMGRSRMHRLQARDSYPPPPKKKKKKKKTGLVLFYVVQLT